MCPGINGQQHSDGCWLDEATNSSKCRCKLGYHGERCEKCETNYWGDPTAPGGECKMCECNRNIDLDDEDSCDRKTGKCLKCLYGTTGDACENCLEGHYGSALENRCLECDCDPSGTIGGSRTNCDQQTGQCRCLPNVKGKRCDHCADNHFNFGSEKGCEPCNCNINGTRGNSASCSEFSGQCDCIPERSGRSCNECPTGFWGDPLVECKSENI